MNFLPIFLISFVLCAENYVSSHVFHFRHPTTESHAKEADHGFTPAPKTVKPHRDVCKVNAICVPPVQCPAHVHGAAPVTCSTIGGRSGVCCTTGQNHTGPIFEKGRSKQLKSPKKVKIDSQMLNSIARHSKMEVHQLQIQEARLMSSRRAMVPPGTASFGHFRNSKIARSTDLMEVMGVATRALEIALATRAFKDRQGLTNQQIELGMMEGDMRPTPLGAACDQNQRCPPMPSRYRNIDGSCNSMNIPTWGSTLSPYSRLLPPSYQDGVWTPRVSEDHGQPLASPRLISTMLFQEMDVPEPNYTLMVMQLGQFISHDLTQTIDTAFNNGSGISCCTEDGTAELPPQFRHFACYPIQISPHDPFFKDFEQGCMNFVRSVLAPNHDCSLGFAQQMNKVTHLLDGSAIYGSTAEASGELRSFEGGLLQTFNDFNRDLLPLNTDPEACLTSEQGSACFQSGDTRTNQMITLAVIHLLFMREHNRVARALGSINPHWGDEDIYAEARHIVVAQLQNIVYKEFLPIVVGEDAMDEFELYVNGPEYSNIYDPSVEPSVTNEFAAAAFRFGHSTVDGQLRIYGKTKMEEAIDIPEVMFHPSRMRKRPFYDEILSTLTTDPIQRVDNGIADALTKYMFRAGNPFGIDLASINIQRGRDHGLRPYNDYRELVGLPRLMHFEEYGPELGPAMQQVYASIDDIDLWVGGLLEPKYPGSIVGLTFRDIIADQFSRLRRGDRYFFDLHPSINPGAFTPEQLNEIKKSSMARLICDNRDGIMIGRQAPNAFRQPGVPGNEFFECEHPAIPTVDLNFWKEF